MTQKGMSYHYQELISKVKTQVILVYFSAYLRN